MAGSGPIQYNELYASDVETGLKGLLGLAQVLDYTFQDLSKTILNSKTRISISIKEQSGELKKVKGDLEGVDVAGRNAGETITNLSKAISENTKRTRDFADTQEGLNNIFDLTTASVDEIRGRIKSLTAEYNSLTRATDADKTAMKALDVEVKTLNKELTSLIGTFGKSQKQIEAAEGSYQQASMRLNDLRKSLREMPGAINAATGEWNKANPAVAGYLKEIQTLDKALKKFDSDMGNHQRSVGNYALATSGLNNSIAQISRELPALAINFQTFALAISNNLPIAVDEIKNLNIQNKELSAQGKPTVNILKAIIGGLFSWQTLLSAGIAIFTIYSGKIAEWVTNLGKADREINKLANRGLNLNDIMKQAGQTAAQETVRLNQLANAVQDVNVLEEQRLRGAKELQEMYPTIFGNMTTEAILNQDLSKAIDLATESIIKKAKAEAAATKITEIATQVNDNEWQKQKIRNAERQELARVRGPQYDINYVTGTTNRVISEEEQKKVIRDRAQASVDAIDKETEALTRQGKFLEQYIDNGSIIEVITGGKTDGEKKKSKDALEQVEERINKITRALQLQALAAVQAGKSFKIDAETAKQLGQLEEQLRFGLNFGRGADIGQSGIDAANKSANYRNLRNLQTVPRGLSSGQIIDRSAINAAQQEAPLLAFNDLLEKFAQADISRQTELTEVYRTEINKRLKLQEDAKESLKESISFLQQNSRVIGELFGQEFGNLFTGILTNLETFITEGKLSFEDLASTAITAVRAIDEAYKQGTALRIEQLQLEKEAQIDIAGTNKDARLNIEDEYNRRIRAEKIKQARIDKAAAIFEISLNTAIAASKVTAQTGLLGIPLIPLIVGLGLAQIAAVLARPIPGFRHGTQNSPEGLAEVAEDGPEAIQDPSGRTRIAHKRQITYLRRGSKVFTKEQTEKMFGLQELERNSELTGSLTGMLRKRHYDNQVQTMTAAFNASRVNPEEIGSAVGSEIAKLPFHSSYFSEDGVKHYVRKGNTQTEVLNKRYSLPNK